jgi:DMSO/TMAO reductase YedYZ molybdopterin-dependent catalytic subunit
MPAFMRALRRAQSVLIVFGWVLSAAVTLHAQQPTPSISVTGSVTTPLTLTAEMLAQMPRSTATISNNGVDTQYEGVSLLEILKKAGVPAGEALRGKVLTTYVLTEAQDGYQVVFSLGELDPVLGDTAILVADKANGKPLFGENGAFRLVVPRDKRAARAVRMLTKIEVVQVRK